MGFLYDAEKLAALTCKAHLARMKLAEYPFDHQLLSLSRLYRTSRKQYLDMGGAYSQKVISLMRGLSTQDLFKNEIEFSPIASEILWFKDHHSELADPEAEVEALLRFHQISLYHEQNHRILWPLLPPAPSEKAEVCKYLNFAESLVVTLDIALADEIGAQLSPVFERLSVIYRSGGDHDFKDQGRQTYRQYLLAVMCATYYILELIHPEDLLKAVNYVLPEQKKVNAKAVRRALDIDELFPRITNPEWQARYWQDASKKLKQMHKPNPASVHYMPEDPLDLEEEFVIARQVLSVFGL